MVRSVISEATTPTSVLTLAPPRQLPRSATFTGSLPMFLMEDLSAGDFAGALPAFTGALVAEVDFVAVSAALAGSIPRVTAGMSGTVAEPSGDATGTIAATLAALTGVYAGTVTSPASATDPLTIVTSQTPFFFLTGDTGVIEPGGPGTGLATWTDQSGQGKNATQTGSSANYPTYSSAGGPSSRGMVTFDAVNDYLEFANWNPPAPGTTPIWFFGVIRPNAWSSGANIYSGSGTNILRLRMSTSTGTLGAANGSSGQVLTNFTVGSWFRFENLFSNSSSDYVKVGPTSTTIPGTITGNTDVANGAFRMCTDTLNRYGNVSWLCFGAWQGEPTTGEKAALTAWVTAYYGGTIGV